MRRRWRAGMLAAALTLAMAAPAPAQAPYAGSARVTPFLVSAHMQLALNQVRWAEQLLIVDSGGRQLLRRDPRPVRQALADASDELALARLATADPDQIRTIDELLAEVDVVRDLLERRALDVAEALHRMEGKMLALHRTARSQIVMREEGLAREAAPVR